MANKVMSLATADRIAAVEGTLPSKLDRAAIDYATRTNLALTTCWSGDTTRWTANINNVNLAALGAGTPYMGRTPVQVTAKTGDWMGGAGGFETSTLFAAQNSATLTRDTSRYHSGTRSLKVQAGTSNSAVDASYSWNTRKDQKVTFSAWIYRPSSNTSPHAAITLGPSNLFDSVVESSPVDADGWQQVTVTATGITTGLASAYLIGSDVAGESVWFDDVTLMVSGSSALGIRTANNINVLNLQAGHTYWVAADIYINSLAVFDGIRMTARDDPNNDSYAAGDPTDTHLQTVPYRDAWFRPFWKITVNPSRTITGIYFTANSALAPDGTTATVHPDGSMLAVDRVMIAEVQPGETEPPPFFDGDSPSDVFGSYSWTGTVQASTSLAKNLDSRIDAIEAKLATVPGAAVADATDEPSAVTQLNALLASLRAAKLIQS